MLVGKALIPHVPATPACLRRDSEVAVRWAAYGLVAFVLMLWIAVAAAAQTDLPQPHVRFRFGISEPESSVVGKFKIEQVRQYQFVVELEYATLAEAARIQRLIGTGQRFPDGRYYAPGVVIPVELKIEQIVQGRRQTVYDKLIPVQGRIYQLLGPTNTSGNYGRLITALPLERGIYEMHARTTTRIPDLEGIPASLAVTYDGRVNHTD